MRVKNDDAERSGILGLGKVSREVLMRSVFPFIPLEEQPSLDGGFAYLRGRTAISHSPSIGVPLEPLGFFAFHYAASNVACLFARPKHLIVGIYLPLGTEESDLCTIAAGIGDEARRYDVTVAAGQTATYFGLEMPLIASTCIGNPIRKPSRIRGGDRVAIVGDVGGEALWLRDLSNGRMDNRWRKFTPLPMALELIGMGGVRLMHDVSEGGVRGALREIAEAKNIRLDVDSGEVPFVRGVESLGQDVMSVPTYGTLVLIIKPGISDELIETFERVGYPFALIGEVKTGTGVYLDRVRMEGLGRTTIDELYGTFKPVRSERNG
jgi:hydrogenase maturation factor